MQDEGVLAKILVEAQGPELACGEPIALFVEDQDAYKSFLTLDPSSYAITTPTKAAVASSPPAIESLPSRSGPVRLSPAAKHRLASAGLSAERLVGTAKHGIVTKEDVVLAQLAGTLKQFPTSVPAQSAQIVPPAPAQPLPAAYSHAPVAAPSVPAVSTSVSRAPVNDRYKDIPNSNMRKVIAKRLTESKATVPHLYVTIDVEIDELLALRQRFKKDLDVAVSVNDLVIKSAALALRDLPRANAKWSKATSTVQVRRAHLQCSFPLIPSVDRTVRARSRSPWRWPLPTASLPPS